MFGRQSILQREDLAVAFNRKAAADAVMGIQRAGYPSPAVHEEKSRPSGLGAKVAAKTQRARRSVDREIRRGHGDYRRS